MATYQHSAPAPARSGGTDVAAWALVALIVVLVCAGAGWALGRNDTPSIDEVARTSDVAARDGLMRGESVGFSEGARLGRREASTRAKAMLLTERRQASQEGYAAGYAAGRARAGDPDAYASAPIPGGAYPAAGYEDVLAAGLFGSDAPGYADSAYDTLGFGAGASTPYLGATSTATTSYGDDY